MEFRSGSGYLSSSRSRKEESSRYHIVVAYSWYFRVTTSSQNQPTNRKKNRRVISKMDFNRKENRRRRRFGLSSLVLVISCNFDKQQKIFSNFLSGSSSKSGFPLLSFDIMIFPYQNFFFDSLFRFLSKEELDEYLLFLVKIFLLFILVTKPFGKA